MIKPIRVEDRHSALEFLALQMTSYLREAELSGLSDIPPLVDSISSLQYSDETFLGYMIDGKLHGAIAYRQKEGVVTISRLMVHPDVYRKGIASRLVLYVMERHPDALWFEVAAGTGNEPALHLYQKLGFQPDGVRPISAGVSLTLLRKRGSAIRTEENKDKGG
ncbi:GNAT family N-acetyltransferase [Paenibacillus larvae]|nr:GNAT family N-acetyltransferase [Paenibacillus larvae]